MRARLLVPLSLLLGVAARSAAQATSSTSSTPSPSQLTVDRIFRSAELAPSLGTSVHWMNDGRSYVDARPDPAGGADIVRVDAVTGAVTVLAPASAVIDERGRRIVVEDIQLSRDERRALLFHNSVRVWRTNTRGTYHVIDFSTRAVTAIAPPGIARAGGAGDANAPSFLGSGLASGVADPDLQQFARFSPDGLRVAYVRANDLWVSDLATGYVRRLTTDGSDDVINGTTDWVYEEELGLSDAFRWSPDSRRIAYWRFDQRAVPAYPMVDETRGQYPVVSVLRYPKAGVPNSKVRVGVVATAGGETCWLAAGPDTGQYIPRVEWIGTDSLAVQRLTRKQDRLDVLMLSATTGTGRSVVSEIDSAYVDVEGEAVTWLADGRFLLRSDRSGWRQFSLYDRAGRLQRAVTPNGSDYLEVSAVDEGAGVAYFLAAAPSARERNVFRCPLAKGECRRVTREAGTHALSVSPTGRYAVDTHSRLGEVPTAVLYEMPEMRAVRTLVDNQQVAARLAALAMRRPEFIKVPMPDGLLLDGYRIMPATFDSTRRYPVLMYAYGGPASPQVTDAWSNPRYLWHQLLAQRGYVVVVVDNRGSAWRGRDFRKVTQYQLGIHESQDQIDAARWIARQPWADPSRIGIWGWSYGGYLTALTLARGGTIFKAGIVVAPVVDWRFYDTIYTERYMWTPQANAGGYRLSAVAPYVGTLTARLLLVHGTGDDNVHPQNSLVLADLLEAANKPFTMLLYPNRTHSISGGNAQSHLFESLTRFVLENL
jgi:dipeptidyl-peptidase-4